MLMDKIEKFKDEIGNELTSDVTPYSTKTLIEIFKYYEKYRNLVIFNTTKESDLGISQLPINNHND